MGGFVVGHETGVYRRPRDAVAAYDLNQRCATFCRQCRARAL